MMKKEKRIIRETDMIRVAFIKDYDRDWAHFSKGETMTCDHGYDPEVNYIPLATGYGDRVDVPIECLKIVRGKRIVTEETTWDED